jgi:hypothetical protein
LRHGQRVQVDDAEDAFVIVLQRDPVADRPEIIAEMQIAGRLDAGKNAVHGAWHGVPNGCCQDFPPRDRTSGPSSGINSGLVNSELSLAAFQSAHRNFYVGWLDLSEVGIKYVNAT